MPNNNTPAPPDSVELQIAKLTFIAATIVAIGDGLAALAAGLALQNLEKPSNEHQQSNDDAFKQTEFTQKQMDCFIKELRHIKKMMR